MRQSERPFTHPRHSPFMPRLSRVATIQGTHARFDRRSSLMIRSAGARGPHPNAHHHRYTSTGGKRLGKFSVAGRRRSGYLSLR
jgi:hypothetical protein